MARKETRRTDYHREYDRTVKGFLTRRYAGMVWRVSGGMARSSSKGRGYVGLPILDREIFYKWALEGSRYPTLHAEWVASGHLLKLTPTVDRVDPRRGYELDNMEWVTMLENTVRGCLSSNRRTKSKYRGVTPRGVRWVATISENKKPVRIGHFATEEEAARAYDRWARRIYGRAVNFP